MCLLLVSCSGDDCPEVACTDSLTVVFEGGGLLDAWTAVLTDEAGREESFKCYGQEVRNLTDDSLLVWCEPEGFTVAGWTIGTLSLTMTDKDGSHSWTQEPTWEPDYGYGEDCPATCETATLTVEKIGPGDSG